MEKSKFTEWVLKLMDAWYNYITAVSEYNENKDLSKENSLANNIRREYFQLKNVIDEISDKFKMSTDENERKILTFSRCIEKNLSFNEYNGSAGDKIR